MKTLLTLILCLAFIPKLSAQEQDAAIIRHGEYQTTFFKSWKNYTWEKRSTYRRKGIVS